MFPHNKGLLRILWPDLRGPTARFMIHVSKLHDVYLRSMESCHEGTHSSLESQLGTDLVGGSLYSCEKMGIGRN